MLTRLRTSRVSAVSSEFGRGPVRTGRGRAGPAPGAAIAVAALAAIGVTALAGCSSGGAAANAQAAGPQVVQPVRVSAAQFAALPRATTYANIPASPLDPDPFGLTSGMVVRPLTAQVLYAGPGKAAVAVLPATELGGPTWVPVVQSGPATPGWERVLLPNRPNRASGWLFTGGKAASQLDTRRSSYLVRINLRARTLSLSDGGKSLGTWTVGIGTKATPTPTGRTFLLALLAPVHPTYSPLILPLGLHSNTLTTFGGGPGTVGVHGWPNPAVFGHAVSHGCVRVPATALHMLSRVPLGSLFVITQ